MWLKETLKFYNQYMKTNESLIMTDYKTDDYWVAYTTKSVFQKAGVFLQTTTIKKLSYKYSPNLEGIKTILFVVFCFFF